jgi:hypothetical protein
MIGRVRNGSQTQTAPDTPPPVAFDEDEGLAEAPRRDAELDANPAQAMTLREVDLHMRQRHKS